MRNVVAILALILALDSKAPHIAPPSEKSGKVKGTENSHMPPPKNKKKPSWGDWRKFTPPWKY